VGTVIDLRAERLRRNRPPRPQEHRAADRLAARLLTSEPDVRATIMRRVDRLAGHQGHALVVNHVDEVLWHVGATGSPAGYVA
jgi:NAD-dependent oxidoreductase involved in siderophore biosynthesis